MMTPVAVQAMEIPLPQVRRLTPTELSARRGAVAAWRARLKQPQPAAQVRQSTNIAASCFRGPHLTSDAMCMRDILSPATQLFCHRLALHLQQKQPAGVQQMAKAAGAVAAGSSSDEESDDDTFLLRHQPLEMEERQRFLSYSIGARRFHLAGTTAAAPLASATAVATTALQCISPLHFCMCFVLRVLLPFRWKHEGASKGRARPQAKAWWRQPPCRR
jgi:hypothetical protein